MKNNVIRAVVIGGLGLVSLAMPVEAIASDKNTRPEANQLLEKENKTEIEARYLLASISSELKKQEREIDSLLAEMTAVQSEVDGVEKQIENLEKKNREKRFKELNSAEMTVNKKMKKIVSWSSEPLIKVNKGTKTAAQLEKIKKELTAEQLKNSQATKKLEKEVKEKLTTLDSLAAKLEAVKTKSERTKLEKELAVVQLAAKTTDAQSSKEFEETSSSKDDESHSSANNKANRQKKHREETTSISRQDIKQKAVDLRGTPYQFGGMTSNGFDSSGFIAYVFEEVATIHLPHDAGSQYAAVKKILKKEVKAGDLVFFSQTGSIDHVGIYLGEDNFIGAQPSSGVAIKELTSDHWRKHIIGYGRVD